MVVEKDETIFELLDNNSIHVDEMVDIISGQRLLHYAVLMNYELLIDYLIEKKANLMARDYNGYTALLKAASLGRLNIVKKLIDAGVPLNHKDPWGNTSYDKASLYQNLEVIDYFKGLNDDTNSDKIGYWKTKDINERFPFSIWVLNYYKNI